MKKEKIIYILLGASIVINLFLIGQVNGLKSEMESIDSKLINLESNLSSINNNIYDIYNQLTEEANFIADVNIKTDIESISTKGCKLKASVAFKDLSEGEEPYILYRKYYEKNTNIEQEYEWMEAKLVETATLSYEGNLDIDYNYDYQYKIVTKGNIERSSEIKVIETNEYQPIDAYINETYSDNKKIGKIITVIQKYDIKGFDVDNIVMKIDGINKVYKAEEITEEDPYYYGDYHYEDKFNSDVEIKKYRIEIPTDDLKPMDYNQGWRMAFIEVICKNGFKLIQKEYGL